MTLILEIAAGIVLGVLILAALPQLMALALGAFAALMGIAIFGVGAFLVYLAWNDETGTTLVLLSVTAPVVLAAFLLNYASRRRAAVKAKTAAMEREKANAAAAFKVFLADSLDRRIKREAQKSFK